MTLPTNVLKLLPMIVAAEAMVLMDLIEGLRGFAKLFMLEGTFALWFCGRPIFVNTELLANSQPFLVKIMVR